MNHQTEKRCCQNCAGDGPSFHGEKCLKPSCPCHQEEQKGDWEKEFDALRPPRDFVPTNGYGFNSESEIRQFGYRHFSRETKTIHEVTDWGNIKNFIRATLSQREKEIAEKVINKIQSDIHTMYEKAKYIDHYHGLGFIEVDGVLEDARTAYLK